MTRIRRTRFAANGIIRPKDPYTHIYTHGLPEWNRDGNDAILALGRAVIVIRAFEDKAEALGNESDLH